LKDLSFEFSRLCHLICPDFEVRAWPFPARVPCAIRRGAQASGYCAAQPARSHPRFHHLEGQSPPLNCSDAARAFHHCRSLSPQALTSTSRPPPAPFSRAAAFLAARPPAATPAPASALLTQPAPCAGPPFANIMMHSSCSLRGAPPRRFVPGHAHGSPRPGQNPSVMPSPPAPSGSPRGRASRRPCRPPAPGVPLPPARASRRPFRLPAPGVPLPPARASRRPFRLPTPGVPLPPARAPSIV
jgi:hypothetical protein